MSKQAEADKALTKAYAEAVAEARQAYADARDAACEAYKAYNEAVARKAYLKATKENQS